MTKFTIPEPDLQKIGEEGRGSLEIQVEGYTGFSHPLVIDVSRNWKNREQFDPDQWDVRLRVRRNDPDHDADQMNAYRNFHAALGEAIKLTETLVEQREYLEVFREAHKSLVEDERKAKDAEREAARMADVPMGIDRAEEIVNALVEEAKEFGHSRRTVWTRGNHHPISVKAKKSYGSNQIWMKLSGTTVSRMKITEQIADMLAEDPNPEEIK